jgi:hypothetical protein
MTSVPRPGVFHHRRGTYMSGSTLAPDVTKSEPNPPKSTAISAHILDIGHSCPIRSGNAGLILDYLQPAFGIVVGKPGSGFEPLTPSLPWKCSTY